VIAGKIHPAEHGQASARLSSIATCFDLLPLFLKLLMCKGRLMQSNGFAYHLLQVFSKVRQF